MENLAEYGVAIFAIAAMVYVIRLMSIKNERETKKFTKVVENHMKHNTKASEELSEAVKKQIVVSDKLLDFLKNNNDSSNKK